MKIAVPITLTTAQARRFMIRATGLEGAFADVASALRHLGFVQIDPINVCGRMQDHILRHRVRGYREQDLMRHVHREGLREAFEHHLPDSSNLAALPLDAWPHLQVAMRARERSDSTWCGKLTAAERKLATRVLARMADEGPLCSQDIESAPKAKNHAWDSTTLAKSTLQKLFFHGRVLIARRDSLRRYYDLPEKVLPTAVLNAPVPTSEESARWLALLNLLRGDLPLLDDASEAEDTPKLIAPLDPIIYDRRVTEALWDFHYRWEVYVPPQKRVRGYYALPLLHRGEFIGHADVKVDREARKLQLLSQDPVRSIAAKKAVGSLASFLSVSHSSSPKTP